MGTQLVLGTTTGPWDHNGTAMGPRDHNGSPGHQWVLGTAMGPQQECNEPLVLQLIPCTAMGLRVRNGFPELQ